MLVSAAAAFCYFAVLLSLFFIVRVCVCVHHCTLVTVCAYVGESLHRTCMSYEVGTLQNKDDYEHSNQKNDEAEERVSTWKVKLQKDCEESTLSIFRSLSLFFLLLFQAISW